MEAEDPWDWSVDRVVQELCTPNRTWEARSNVASTPDPTSLENALREQEVTGSVLLTEVDDTVLRNDFGIKILGRRAFVREAISVLQSKSQKYIQDSLRKGLINSHHSPTLAGSPIPFSNYHFGPALSYAQPQHFPFGAQGHFGGLQQTLQSPGCAMLPPQFSPFGQLPANPATTGDDRIARGGFVISDSEGSKRRKLDLAIPANDLALPEENISPNQTLLVEQTNVSPNEPTPPLGEDTPPMDHTTSPTPDSNGKKRKRIAPTLITSEIDPNRNRDIPTEADTVVEPGVVFIDENGRKRMMPVHQQNSDFEDPYDYAELVRKRRETETQALFEGGHHTLGAAQNIIQVTERKRVEAAINPLETGYLGKKMLPVDEVFYGGTKIGDEIPNPENSSDFFESQKISTGRRLYVNRLIKGFFKAKRENFARGGKHFTAIRPYSLKLVPTYHNPSFTLFSSNEAGRTIAKREGLRNWPEINPEAPSKDQIGIDPNSVLFLLATKSYLEDFDPESLRKWDTASNGDKILPLYGESDEENEFDDETWKEIEEEFGTKEKPALPLRKSTLSMAEVNEAIDEGIKAFVEKWRKYQLPKMQRKALKTWKRTRPRDARRAKIDQVQEFLDRINNYRIPKIREEIASELWTSQLQVRKQMHSMEQSIFDRETSQWELELVKSSLRPEKPLPKAPSSKKPAPISDDGVDGETLASETDESSSEDDLDDFIVDDMSSPGEENEFNLADGEIEPEDTEGSTPPKDIWRSAKLLKKRVKRSIEYDVLSEVDEPVSNSHEDTPMSGISNNRSSGTPRRSSTSTPTKSSAIKEEQTLPKLSKHSPNDSISMIDLTMLSSDDNKSINLSTPKKKQPLVRLFIDRENAFRSISPSSRGPIILSDGEDPQSPDPKKLPSLYDPAGVAKFSTQAWAKRSDRKRLLIAMLHAMTSNHREFVFSFLSDLTEMQLWNHMQEVMDSIPQGEKSVKGLDAKTYKILLSLIRLFYSFVLCKERSASLPPSTKLIADLKDARDEWFPKFYRHCLAFEGYFQKRNSLKRLLGKEDDEDDEDDEDEEPQSGNKRRRSTNTSGEDDDDDHATFQSKCKKPIFEDAKARDLREQDKARQKEQDERRKMLHLKLAQFGSTASQHEIIINDSKFDDQGFIYVNDTIARRIKPHQVKGVRFMWNQVVTQDKELQGCLLAHTMGLGKTMQVITLLVAIAESSRSTEPSIYSQIPLSLRASKTLIICPPTLIDNWMDELLMWTADKDVLGEFRKVDSALKPISKRLDLISAWYHGGGILVMGYDGFRMLIDNKETSIRGKPLTIEQHNQVSKHLLDGPNIIVADEAHKMKNSNSAITKAAVRFRSHSRIALTGSPLANNVAEYYTMIDWVAPNYLGPAREFRQKYVEPIQQGLWHDSNSTERRKSLKMLGVLKVDLDPKVHRADMSVLRKDDLQPKKEFVITVPLTDLQSKAYTIYVRSMVEKGSYAKTKDGEVASTTLWHWLAILSLLCNHPKCFDTKLKERKEEARKELGANETANPFVDNTDQEEKLGDDLNAPIWKVGVSQDLINEVTSLFAAETSNLGAIDLSNKVKILTQILDASKAVGDKVLVFSQSLPTLDYLEKLCKSQNRVYARLDGKTKMGKRQEHAKNFNNSGDTELYLISTAAGGLGLNLPGANRVVIFDFKFNPIQEEQAIGRAYRIGQVKPVFVYRFVVGGTFENSVHNKTIFKMQLASRVVDKKNPIARASRKFGEFLFEPKHVEQMDLSEFQGRDPHVLDKILACQSTNPTIRGIVESHTFERDDEDKLTSEEQKEVDQLVSDKQMERTDPQAYYVMLAKRQKQSQPHQTAVPLPGRAMMPSYSSAYPLGPAQSPHQMHQNSGAGPVLPLTNPVAILPGAKVTAAQPQQNEMNGNHGLPPPDRNKERSTPNSTPLLEVLSAKGPKSKADTKSKVVTPSVSPPPQTNGANGEKVVSTATPTDRTPTPGAVSGSKSKKSKAVVPKATNSSDNVSTASSTPLSAMAYASNREKQAPKTEGVAVKVFKHSDVHPSRGRSPVAGVNTRFRSITPEGISPRDHRKALLRRSKSSAPTGRSSPTGQSPSPSSSPTLKHGVPSAGPLFEIISEGLFSSPSGSSKASRFPLSKEDQETANKVTANIVRAFTKYLPDPKERNPVLRTATTALASNGSICRKLANGTIAFDKFARRYVDPAAIERATVAVDMKDTQDTTMFKAMAARPQAKQPTRSLRDPVTSSKPPRTSKEPIDKNRQKNRLSSTPQSTNPTSSHAGSVSMNSSTAAAARIPSWAEDQIRDADRSQKQQKSRSSSLATSPPRKH